jgi:hypothetical protein
MSLNELVQKKLKLEHQWAQQVLQQNNVTPEMKWIDIEIKGLKVKINDQTVNDARAEVIKDINSNL